MKQLVMRTVDRRHVVLPRFAAAMVAFALLGFVTQQSWSFQQQRTEPEQQRAAAQQSENAPEQERRPQRTEGHVGELVTVEDGRITMTVKGRNEHSHQVASDAQVTIDGRPAKLEELAKGDVIRVTTQNEAVVAIEARRERARARNVERGAVRREAPGRSSRGADDDRAWLGVTLRESAGGGVLIADVFPDGPADHAGIRPGDYLMNIDGQSVSSVQGASDAIVAIQPETEVTLTIFRDRNERRVFARLGARHEMRSLVEANPLFDDPLFDDESESTEMPEPACEECVQKLAEQHRRLEEQLRALVTEVEALRSALAESRAGSPRGASQPRTPTRVRDPQSGPNGEAQQPGDSGR